MRQKIGSDQNRAPRPLPRSAPSCTRASLGRRHSSPLRKPTSELTESAPTPRCRGRLLAAGEGLYYLLRLLLRWRRRWLAFRQEEKVTYVELVRDGRDFLGASLLPLEKPRVIGPGGAWAMAHTGGCPEDRIGRASLRILLYDDVAVARVIDVRSRFGRAAVHDECKLIERPRAGGYPDAAVPVAVDVQNVDWRIDGELWEPRRPGADGHDPGNEVAVVECESVRLLGPVGDTIVI